ncbi:hypothetical protein, partial [Streptomyces sp. SID7804]|uniref:hypothetical protein n=1 Tax=Streptomyces sp. SID7804 TaxID=2690327 RepID=UPI001928EC43
MRPQVTSSPEVDSAGSHAGTGDIRGDVRDVRGDVKVDADRVGQDVPTRAAPLTIVVSEGPPPGVGTPEAAELLDGAGTDRAVVLGPAVASDGSGRPVRAAVELTREAPGAPVKVRPLTGPPSVVSPGAGGTDVTAPDAGRTDVSSTDTGSTDAATTDTGTDTPGSADTRGAADARGSADTVFPGADVLLPLADALGVVADPAPRPVTESTGTVDDGSGPVTPDAVKPPKTVLETAAPAAHSTAVAPDATVTTDPVPSKLATLSLISTETATDLHLESGNNTADDNGTASDNNTANANANANAN